jgi:putative protease
LIVRIGGVAIGMSEAETSQKGVRPVRGKPELLAPAGDRECLRAAIENGADAVYFGVQGHNARARAANFDVESLPEVMSELHRRGVKGYVTLNTLIFPGELDGVETLARKIADAGVDAVIVQDLGLVRLLRALAPELEVHASTQMSVTSVEGVELARSLGCSRVILARELSLREIGKIQENATLPVEVFIHGALCVAYSGQCLTSEALGGRSANRGECAQACRMPYEIICDGQSVDLKDVQYLLSPQDLAAYDLIPQLIDLGVASLKIEGRLKSPEYVANITSHYRRAIDEAWENRPSSLQTSDVQDMEMSFSRGFSHGFFDGNDHKVLVRGDYAKKRGIFVGRVASIHGDKVRVALSAPLKPGDGVVFDGDEPAGVPEQGGRVYEVCPVAGHRSASSGIADLAFGRLDLDTRQIRVGQRIWKTDDPDLTRRLRASFEGRPNRLVDLDIHIQAITGQSLILEGTTSTGLTARIVSSEVLEPARKLPATSENLRSQVDRLGDTLYRLRDFRATIDGEPLVPKSLLNRLRRELVDRIDASSALSRPHLVASDPVVPAFRAALWSRAEEPGRPLRDVPVLTVLCRTIEQARAAALAGISTIYLDFHDIKELKEGVEIVRSGSHAPNVFIATPRIEKPGEANLFKYLAKQGADGLLVRNAGGIAFCQATATRFIADFSLNAANDLTVEYLQSLGSERVTASYDLSLDQLLDLLKSVPPQWLEIVIHQHMPMFHMEHCVFCAFLSPGTDKTNCGRPCDRHDVKLKDRVGMEHPLQADVGCRNTLFNAVPQTAAEFLPRLIDRGARILRIELLEEDASETARTLKLYQDALIGRRDAKTLWKALKATGTYGVTRGQLTVIG